MEFIPLVNLPVARNIDKHEVGRLPWLPWSEEVINGHAQLLHGRIA